MIFRKSVYYALYRDAIPQKEELFQVATSSDIFMSVISLESYDKLPATFKVAPIELMADKDEFEQIFASVDNPTQLFHKLLELYHPDKGGDPAVCARIIRAYERCPK